MVFSRFAMTSAAGHWTEVRHEVFVYTRRPAYSTGLRTETDVTGAPGSGVRRDGIPNRDRG